MILFELSVNHSRFNDGHRTLYTDFEPHVPVAIPHFLVELRVRVQYVVQGLLANAPPLGGLHEHDVVGECSVQIFGDLYVKLRLLAQ